MVERVCCRLKMLSITQREIHLPQRNGLATLTSTQYWT